MRQRPEKLGISKVSRVYKDSAGGPPLSKLRAGGSLADLQNDYVFFSYAPLILYGGLTFNPIQEWINQHNHKQVVFILTLEKSVFDLKMGGAFDDVLWGVEKLYWDSLALHIGSMAIINRHNKSLFRVVCQQIPIQDVHKKSLTASYIDVYTFGVDSNTGMCVIQPLINARPTVLRLPPSDETTKLAKALLAHSDNPYNEVQAYPWELTNENQSTSAS